MQTPTTLETITTQDGLITRTTTAYIDDGELFIRTRHDTDGPVDLFHVHADERIRLSRALILAEGMLRPAPIPTKVIPIRSMQDMITVGRWPA